MAYEDKYRVQVSDPVATKIICTHPQQGTEIFWIPVENFFLEVTSVIRPY